MREETECYEQEEYIDDAVPAVEALDKAEQAMKALEQAVKESEQAMKALEQVVKELELAMKASKKASKQHRGGCISVTDTPLLSLIGPCYHSLEILCSDEMAKTIMDIIK